MTKILQLEHVSNVDLLSIDVEGAELDVLLGLDLQKYKPRLILLEDKHLYLPKHRYLKENRYNIVPRLNRNCWYIPKDTKGPTTSFSLQLRLCKRMYISIWFRKIEYVIRHRNWEPFQTL